MSALRRLFTRTKKGPKSKPVETASTNTDQEEPNMSASDPLTEVTQKTADLSITAKEETDTGADNPDKFPYEVATFAMS